MPTENERKYVLDPAKFPSEIREGVLDYPCCLISQYYLHSKKKSSLRVRSYKQLFVGNPKEGHTMTFKRMVNGRVVEVNAEIDRRDFLDLASCAKTSLCKIRGKVDGWEIDFFLKFGQVYFVLAEFEMPEGQDKPESMPDLVRSSLIFEVPRNDDRFSSRKLADSVYAKKLLKKVQKESK